MDMRRFLPAVLLLLACACASGGGETPGGRPAEAPLAGPLTEAQFAALHTLSTQAPPAPTGTDVGLPGTWTRAYLSLPQGRAAPHAAVLVLHEWWGLNDHIRHAADRIASEGYAALAVDLYEGHVATTREEAGRRAQGVDEVRAAAVIAAAHRFVLTDPRVQAPKVAVLGWCFGGGWSLRTALAEPNVSGAVVFYGQPILERDRLKTLSCPVLAIFGTRDASIPMDRVKAFDAALTAAGVRHQVLTFDAEHAFANPSGERYASGPAEQAWTAVRAFLAERLR